MQRSFIHVRSRLGCTWSLQVFLCGSLQPPFPSQLCRHAYLKRACKRQSTSEDSADISYTRGDKAFKEEGERRLHAFVLERGGAS